MAAQRKDIEDIKSRLELMEARITNNLKTQLKAIVDDSIQEMFEQAQNERSRSSSTEEDIVVNLQKLNDRIDRVFTKSDRVSKDIEKLGGRMTSMDGHLKELVKKNESLESQVTSFKSCQEQLNMSLEQHTLQLGNLQTSMNDLSAKKDELHSDLVAVQKAQKLAEVEMKRQQTFSENVNKSVASIENLNRALYERCEVLQAVISEKNRDLEDLNSFIRQDNLELHGIPKKADEDTDQLVLQVVNTLGIELQRSDISSSHRLPAKDKSVVPPILVRFTSRNMRNKVLSKKRELPPMEKFGMIGLKLYINEHLTKFKKELLYKARSLRKDSKLEFVWSAGGNIYVKERKDSRRIRINSPDDLKQFS